MTRNHEVITPEQPPATRHPAGAGDFHGRNTADRTVSPQPGILVPGLRGDQDPD